MIATYILGFGFSFVVDHSTWMPASNTMVWKLIQMLTSPKGWRGDVSTLWAHGDVLWIWFLHEKTNDNRQLVFLPMKECDRFLERGQFSFLPRAWCKMWLFLSASNKFILNAISYRKANAIYIETKWINLKEKTKKIQSSAMLLVTFCIYLSSLLISAFGLSDQCLGPEVSLRINPDADVKFTVILSLREPTADNKCGSEWSDVAAQTVAVIQWAVERINNASFIQGIKLGKFMISVV